MEVKIAAPCLQWSQSVLPHSPSSSQTLASAISSPSSRRRSPAHASNLACRFVHKSNFFGATYSSRLYRSQSLEHPFSQARTIRRACSASLESFSDEEFSKKIEDLAFKFQLSGDKDDANNATDSESEIVDSGMNITENYCEESSRISFLHDQTQNSISKLDTIEPLMWLESRQDPPGWSGGDEIILANIERKVNSVDLPLSLRMIKKKLQWKEGFREVGGSAYCSVKKAFSSMVFIIRELHSYTLQMREILFYEDLQGILVRVQKEMHASFVWLFQQVFSHTPTLMVYVMILLANFTVYSMGHNAAVAAATPPPAATTEVVSVSEIQEQKNQKFDSSSVKTFSVSSSSGKTTSIGGNNGGGGKARPLASGTDGEGWSDRHHRAVIADGGSQFSSLGTTGETEETRQEELEAKLWKSMVEEASKMQGGLGGEGLDHETMKQLISPVSADIESDDYAEYLRTELVYQTGLSQEPNNPLLLANYAQFLYLVAHDYDRAEEHFKRAVKVEPADAEAYNKYATFLWKVKNDLWGAEETFLEAISAEPNNSYYAANYAHFLWNTGGDDTCFPLNPPETSQES